MMEYQETYQFNQRSARIFRLEQICLELGWRYLRALRGIEICSQAMRKSEWLHQALKYLGLVLRRTWLEQSKR